MNLNNVLINKDLSPMIEHILTVAATIFRVTVAGFFVTRMLRLEAFGGKSFPADLEF